jgi:osmotically-inducible protein OsmY
MREHTSMQQWRLGKGWGILVVAVLLMIHGTAVVLAGTTGEAIDDAIITTKVKSSLVADATVSALDINVDTSQGVVKLTGVVNSDQERQRAIQIAHDTEGVKQVDSRNLVVRR